ncbi:hypothetical protein COCC4DRAFT_128695 [Bipolaris maydis ATCC 48331]|uniref:C2H2-type domain-containing protein n=2 Tax=Cochliobolus heterostrophus TaxID=5016 RepID=M2UCQ4_COCH5|nr:uncharacterized protein COCC4DRAFT_128695 [Bipolaris maydis ATCC 48331]EMD91481.1 hypothetical protein COCHEDRAFT_1175451 [Bipolaris maydis C5]KAJ5027338.1 hypothetical protein J3E73DRAFT_231192 [Bipolaris maydis]ENI08761.1 hypothetical protein COCC4DRAFT_128695 [Bipolaris maydis ATCC 48331]KAJ6208874.1 hypothetical protein PSV09DRAFT_1175451 [Bipolaris maydis]KAJ6270764.1 hypothetical protein PSV08DRAFT_409807 [Bipolaris maydis]
MQIMPETGSGFDGVDWLEHQQMCQTLPSMDAQSAEGIDAHHTHQYCAPYPENCRERALAGHWGQNGHLISTHSQHHVGSEGYSAEQPPSRVVNQDPGSFRENAVYCVNGPHHGHRTMESRHTPLMPVHNRTCYQDESAPNAYHGTHIQPELFQQAPNNFSNSVHETANNAYAPNFNTLSHLGAHVIDEDTCGTPKSSSSDLQFQQYYGKEPEISIDLTLDQEQGSVSMPESTPEPWNAIGLMDGSQTTRSTRQTQTGMNWMPLHAARSMSAYGDPSPVPSVHSGFETFVSSESPYFPQSSGPANQTDVFDSYRFPLGIDYTSSSRTNFRNRERLEAEGAAMTRGHLERYPRSDPGRYLGLPGKRRASSASSQITEATSSSAVSGLDQGVLRCGVNRCEATFSGRYGKGNRARHKRDYHGGKEPVICEDSNCGKVFRRSDARLKHYRSHHPHLVGRNTLVMRLGRRNPAPGGLDGDA